MAQMSDLRDAISRARGYWPARHGFVIAIIPGLILDVVGPMEIATVIEVMDCANVLRKENPVSSQIPHEPFCLNRATC